MRTRFTKALSGWFARGLTMTVVACADTPRGDDRDAAADDTASYDAVAEIVHKSCSYSRCHAGAVVGAGLFFDATGDFAAPLVDVTACEYEGMKRVAPFGPDHSWLMVKLTAQVRDRDDPYSNYIYFDAGKD
ncbi:MAG: hypothetical protein RL701_3067 [Pseudomonadota bacterium]